MVSSKTKSVLSQVDVIQGIINRVNSPEGLLQFEIYKCLNLMKTELNVIREIEENRLGLLYYKKEMQRKYDQQVDV